MLREVDFSFQELDGPMTLSVLWNIVFYGLEDEQDRWVNMQIQIR